jgi:hypothetical protein
MLQLKNSTPFAANMALFPNEQGVDTLYLMVKASFKIGSKWVLADEQIPPVEADEYWGEPNESSLKYASDYHIGKPATDIVMLGNAYAPNATPVKQLDVSLEVGKVNKTVRVFGNRVWKNGSIAAAEPFQTMPMIYEKAFGGSHITDEVNLIDEKNPVGSGYVGKRSVSEMNNIALPNLEDPAMLIQKISDQPEPACFAFSSPTWKPRVNFVGTYDKTWQTQRAPYLPEDFNRRFLNMAHRSLIYPGYLEGGEQVRITNMHSSGDMQFNLPRVNIVSEVEVSNQLANPAFTLETLLIEPNQLQLSMVWRAALQCDKQTLKIKDISISLSR